MNRADGTGTCVRPGLQGRAYTPRKARWKGPSNGPARPPEPTSKSHPAPGVLPSVEPRPSGQTALRRILRRPTRRRASPGQRPDRRIPAAGIAGRTRENSMVSPYIRARSRIATGAPRLAPWADMCRPSGWAVIACLAATVAPRPPLPGLVRDRIDPPGLLAPPSADRRRPGLSAAGPPGRNRHRQAAPTATTPSFASRRHRKAAPAAAVLSPRRSRQRRASRGEQTTQGQRAAAAAGVLSPRRSAEGGEPWETGDPKATSRGSGGRA